MKLKIKNILTVMFLTVAVSIGATSAMVNQLANDKQPIKTYADYSGLNDSTHRTYWVSDHGWIQCCNACLNKNGTGALTLDESVSSYVYVANYVCATNDEFYGHTGIWDDGWGDPDWSHYDKHYDNHTSGTWSGGGSSNIKCVTPGVYTFTYMPQHRTSINYRDETGTIYIDWGTITVNLYYVDSSGNTLQTASSTTTTSENNFAAPDIPTIIGYTSPTKWRVGSTSGDEYTAQKLTTSATFNFYAVYTAKTSLITFDKGSGTGGSNSTTATYGSAMPSGLLAPTNTGYYFAGYYDGSGGTGNQYYNSSMASSKNWDKDTTDGTTLYAKWNTPRTIYYISDVTSGEDNTGNYIYTWTDSSEDFGAWPGKTVVSKSTPVSIVMNFRSTYRKIYRITVNDDYFKFSNYNQSAQTGDLTTNNNYAYRWDSSTATSSADEGAALYVIDSIETARNAVTEHGSIKEYSICGIGQSTASSLVKAYDDLNDTAKGYVDTSFTYTYTADGSAQENVYFTAIINRLRIIAANGSNSAYRGFALGNIFGSDDNNVTTIIIVVASSVALLSVTALSILVIKKRKNMNHE